MTLTPIDPHDHDYSNNPFLLERSREKSRLLQAANKLSESQKAAETEKAQGRTATGTLPPPAARLPHDSSHFTISTHKIIDLFARFRIRNMTYQQLYNMPQSQLSPQEKDFVNYLRRNPNIFEQLSSLDSHPGSLSIEDVKMASRLAGDGLVLSDQDFQYLKEAPIKRPQRTTASPLFDQQSASSPKLQTQDLLNTLQRINPQGLSFTELMAIQAAASNLRGRELESLRFLQSPTISKVLEKLTVPYDGRVTPDVLRILASLLWNPAIYGAAPIVFFRTAPLSHETDIDAPHAVEEIEEHAEAPLQDFQPAFRLEAHHVMNICHNLSPDGHVTLEQLRHYTPQNPEEEKALNLLRQSQIFQTLATLDSDDDLLSDADIKIALTEKVIILSDPHIVLVILP